MARDAFLDQESSGGPYEITVTKAWFGQHSQKFLDAGGDPNELVLHWEGTTDREGQPIMTADEGYHPSWSFGSGWQTLDGGKTAKHANGGGKVGGKYGKMITFAVEAVDAAGIAPDSADDPFAGDAHPTKADMWVGTKWLVERRLPKNAQTEGQYKEKERDYPVKYLGRGGAAAPAGAATTTATVAAAPAAPAAGGDALIEQLTTLAQNLPWQAFQSAAFQIPGVSDRPDLVAELATEAGFYTKVRG